MPSAIANPYVVAFISGALLGFSAPGFGQWWLAWIGLVPLALLVFSSRNTIHAVSRGMIFGVAYNLVALTWFLHLNPPWWVGLQEPSTRLALCIGMWLVAGFINGTVYALATCALHLVRLLSTKLKRGQSAVLILSSAFAFSLVEHTVSYIPDLLLLPLSLLEYSQFHQPALLQICAITGGGGLCAFIVAVNTAAALALLSRFRNGVPPKLQPTFNPNPSKFFIYVGIAATIVIANFIFGTVKLSDSSGKTPASPVTVTVVQPGTAQECDRLKRDLSAKQVFERIENLLLQCPPGIVVWPETALFNVDQQQIDSLKALSQKLRLNMIIGFLEREASGKMFNSVLAISEDGTMSDHFYRKRCLIPFGEFEPIFLRVLPESLKKNLPNIPKFTPGSESIAIKIVEDKAISPIVCGENMDALVCAQSVASGGNMIVDLSNLEWFKYSQASEFTEAVCAVRAVENQRWLVYASDSGPSFVIDPAGRTVAFANWGEVRLLTARAEYRFEVTPFARWVAALKFLR